MRKVITEPSFLGSTDIGAIELDAKSRDDIPVLLIGLQAIYLDEATRRELFRLLEAHILPGRRRNTGRPGMDLWRILVMGVLKQGLRCDFDRLREIVNRHADVQAFLGHDVWFDPCRYELRNIRDNVALPAPELLGKAGDLVVGTGHKVAGKSLAQRWSGAVTRSWWRRTSTIRPMSICFGIRPFAWSGRRRGPAGRSAFPDGAGGGIGSARSAFCSTP